MSSHSSEQLLLSATLGFDQLFANNVVEAKVLFESHLKSSDEKKEGIAFHQLGLGVCVFLEAALGLEKGKMEEATKMLAAAVESSSAALKSNKQKHGLEYEILHADAVVLHGLTNALSESYMGYLQCMYALNNAHGRFTKLYKNVFPHGLEGYKTPSASPSVSRKSSDPSIKSTASAPAATKSSGLFSRWTGGASLTVPSTPASLSTSSLVSQDGPVPEMIIAGTAFGFGLFNLVFSLLPKRIQSVVGFFGYKHDRQLALQALAVSAAKSDVHSIFAGLVLMTYYGVVLLLSGWQADEEAILKRYGAVVDRVQGRYPTGTLWILNRAKILRMARDSKQAIDVLEDGLKVETAFKQADTLLVFELAWSLLAERRHEDAAKAFIRVTELNTWSHATYLFIVAGCYLSLGDEARARETWEKLPETIDNGKKMGGKDLPVEVLIRKKLEFYREKAARRGETDIVKVIKISPAEEMAIFWNTHARIDKACADAHLREWARLRPTPTIHCSYIDAALASEAKRTAAAQAAAPTSTLPDLDTPDELALRSLLIGVVLRTVGEYQASLAFLREASGMQGVKSSTWIAGVGLFEEAVTTLHEADATQVVEAEKGESVKERNKRWERVLKGVDEKLEKAMSVSGSTTDLSSRLDSRVSMLRDEMAAKKQSIGL